MLLLLCWHRVVYRGNAHFPDWEIFQVVYPQTWEDSHDWWCSSYTTTNFLVSLRICDTLDCNSWLRGGLVYCCGYF